MTHSHTTHAHTPHSRTPHSGMARSLAAKAARGGLLAAAALLALGAAPARATAEPTPDPFSGNWLFLTVTRGEAPHENRHVTLLRCDPPQGHVRAAEACAQLDKAGGDISRLRAGNSFCAMIYAPVTARALGQWNGRPVDYTETFSNRCVMGARTGSLFALDD